MKHIVLAISTQERIKLLDENFDRFDVAERVGVKELGGIKMWIFEKWLDVKKKKWGCQNFCK